MPVWHAAGDAHKMAKTVIMCSKSCVIGASCMRGSCTLGKMGSTLYNYSAPSSPSFFYRPGPQLSQSIGHQYAASLHRTCHRNAVITFFGPQVDGELTQSSEQSCSRLAKKTNG